jgi:hypothetical protein
MPFIIIETHGGAEYAAIATNENGENLTFDHRPEAEEYASDFQSPIIVEVQ